jgi:hypothetical protein
MKEISSILRKAVIDSLSPLVFEGLTIPIFDERVNPNVQLPGIRGANVYVIIRDQSETETTNDKCQFRQNANITIDVVTKYPLNAGGKRLSEEISGIIQETILKPNLVLDGFNILSVRKSISRGLTEQGVTLTAYRKIITYIFDVYQNDELIT